MQQRNITTTTTKHTAIKIKELATLNEHNTKKTEDTVCMCCEVGIFEMGKNIHTNEKKSDIEVQKMNRLRNEFQWNHLHQRWGNGQRCSATKLYIPNSVSKEVSQWEREAEWENER